MPNWPEKKNKTVEGEVFSTTIGSLEPGIAGRD
jgi:hypothetical protein